MSFYDILIPVVAAIAFSLLAGIFINKEKGFSSNGFLCGAAISISILIWTSILDTYCVIFSIICIVLILFSDENGD